MSAGAQPLLAQPPCGQWQLQPGPEHVSLIKAAEYQQTIDVQRTFQQSGPPNDPTFQFVMTVTRVPQPFTVVGQGNKKKSAEAVACAQAVELLQHQQVLPRRNLPPQSQAHAQAQAQSFQSQQQLQQQQYGRSVPPSHQGYAPPQAYAPQLPHSYSSQQSYSSYALPQQQQQQQYQYPYQQTHSTQPSMATPASWEDRAGATPSRPSRLDAPGSMPPSPSVHPPRPGATTAPTSSSTSAAAAAAAAAASSISAAHRGQQQQQQQQQQYGSSSSSSSQASSLAASRQNSQSSLGYPAQQVSQQQQQYPAGYAQGYYQPQHQQYYSGYPPHQQHYPQGAYKPYQPPSQKLPKDRFVTDSLMRYPVPMVTLNEIYAKFFGSSKDINCDITKGSYCTAKMSIQAPEPKEFVGSGRNQKLARENAAAQVCVFLEERGYLEDFENGKVGNVDVRGFTLLDLIQAENGEPDMGLDSAESTGAGAGAGAGAGMPQDQGVTEEGLDVKGEIKTAIHQLLTKVQQNGTKNCMSVAVQIRPEVFSAVAYLTWPANVRFRCTAPNKAEAERTVLLSAYRFIRGELMKMNLLGNTKRANEPIPPIEFDGETQARLWSVIKRAETERLALKREKFEEMRSQEVWDMFHNDFHPAAKQEQHDSFHHWSSAPIHTRRVKLPVHSMRETFLDLLFKNQVIVVSGETGSGKTTQLPQYILDCHIVHHQLPCRIFVTQPRRIAAISVAQRVAYERGEQLGKSVGYQVRLESVVPQSPGQITYCTTGILAQIMQHNARLQGVNYVVMDEVHEHDLHTDFLLILLRELLATRSDLKLVIMSATVDAKSFCDYFAGSVMARVPGSLYPVTEYYSEDISSFIPAVGRRRKQAEPEQYSAEELDVDMDLCIEVILYITQQLRPGGILVFLPGFSDILALSRMLRTLPGMNDERRFVICCVHSSLSSKEQARIFETVPSDCFKIILSTNIAESSVTIDDVVYVVNSGLVKLNMIHPGRHHSVLKAVRISTASQIQRRGRAGRVQAGYCFHLYSRHVQLQPFLPAEMQRVSLEQIVLQCRLVTQMPSQDFLAKAMYPPTSRTVHQACDALIQLGALDFRENFTPLGRRLVKLPTDPRAGKVLLLAALFGQLDLAASVIAMTDEKDPFMVAFSTTDLERNSRLRGLKLELAGNIESDTLCLHNCLREWLATDRKDEFCETNMLDNSKMVYISRVREQLKRVIGQLGYPTERSLEADAAPPEEMCRMVGALLLAGYFPQVALAHKSDSAKDDLLTMRYDRVYVYPASLAYKRDLRSNWQLYLEQVETRRMFIKSLTPVNPLMLLLFAGRMLVQRNSGQEGTVELFLEDAPRVCFHTTVQLAELVIALRREWTELFGYCLETPHYRLSACQKELLQELQNVIVCSRLCFDFSFTRS